MDFLATLLLLGGFSTIVTVARSSCPEGSFTCANGSCLPGDRVCDGADSCGDNSDEIFCKIANDTCWTWQSFCDDGTCTNGTYQCNNGKCIDGELACDRKDDCGDSSDEIRDLAGFKCPLGRGGDICVLPQKLVSDEFTHCTNGADAPSVRALKHTTFQCFEGSMLLASAQQCDGVIDCPDLSDECPCEQRIDKLCDLVCTHDDEWGVTNCTVGTLLCEKEQKEIPFTKVCDGTLDCADQMDELYCSAHTNNTIITCPGDVANTTHMLARLCDGRPECFDLSDECGPQCNNGMNSGGFCALSALKTTPFHQECASTDGGTYNLTVNDICDGMWSSCTPEITAEELSCPSRLYCANDLLLSIDTALKCDGHEQCSNGTDELQCDERYYCDKGIPVSVPEKFVADGVSDCQFGADECPRYLDDEAVASTAHLVANPFYRFWIWLVAFLALFGNWYIIAKTIRKLPKLKKSNNLSKCHHIILVQLAFADSIMGIYLFGIAVKETLVTGQYCKFDVAWRTSRSCFWLGAASVVSCESSVFMLTILTTLRLISIYNPFKSANIKVKWVVFASAIAWATSLLIALLPIVPPVSEAFTYGAWIPSKFITSRNVNLNATRRFASLLTEYSSNVTYERLSRHWLTLASFLHKNFDEHHIKALFGYYSQHSVCLPNFYVSTKEKLWGFSAIIVLTNFFIFIYIAVAYAAIYRKSTSSKVRSTADRGSKLQMKVIRLVVSDFLCWMPVCIIALLNLSGAIVAGGVAYATTAIIILPINSVLNPLLYSNLLDVAWRKGTKCFKTALVSNPPK